MPRGLRPDLYGGEGHTRVLDQHTGAVAPCRCGHARIEAPRGTCPDLYGGGGGHTRVLDHHTGVDYTVAATRTH
jgi:hypothetical protein